MIRPTRILSAAALAVCLFLPGGSGALAGTAVKPTTKTKARTLHETHRSANTNRG